MGSAPNDELRIDVEVEPSNAEVVDAGTPAGSGFREALLGRLRELTSDLELPLEPTIAVAAGADADDVDTYRVRIDGRACEVARPGDRVTASTPERLADTVAGTIAHNRELLVGQATVERLLQEWTAQTPELAALTAEQFRGVVTQLVRCCVGVAPRPLDELHEELGEATALDSADHVWEAALSARGLPSLRVFVGDDLAGALGRDAQSSARAFTNQVTFSLASSVLKHIFFEELGLLLPDVAFEVDPALADGEFRIKINDLRFPPLEGLRDGEAMVNAAPAALAEIDVAAREAVHPTQGTIASIATVDDGRLARLGEHEFQTWGPEGQIVLTLAREIRRHAGAFLVSDVVNYHLNQLRPAYELVVDTALQRFDFYRLTAVLRQLLAEQISVRDLAGILEGALAVNGGVTVDQSRYRLVSPEAASLWPIDGTEATTPGIDAYADCVRRHLRDQVTSAHAGPGGQLKALLVDERLEARLRLASTTPLDEQELERLHNSVWTAFEAAATSGVLTVVLTNSEVRRSLRQLLERAFPSLLVVSRDELAPGTNVNAIDRIAWA